MATETTIEVRYPDCDRMGIVHHAVYPLWYEMARMDFFKEFGFSFSDMNSIGVNPPMVELDLRYKGTVTYPGKVTIKTRLTFYAPKKIELKYELFSEGHLCASARSFHIWTGPDMRSYDMEKNLPEIYEKIKASYEPDAAE